MADLVTQNTIFAESGGRLNARNPRSSATGPAQFIDGTWLAMIRKYRPDLAAGKSDSQILALRTDPVLGKPLAVEMTARYGAENRDYLNSRGLQGEGNTYLAHFAGPQGAAAVLSNPNAPVERLLSPGAIEANPFLRGMTGQQVIDWASRKETGVASNPASAMAANLRRRFGSGTMGGATRVAGQEAVNAGVGSQGIDNLKKALKASGYDADQLDLGQSLQKAGIEAGTKAKNWQQSLLAALTAGVGGYVEGEQGAAKKANDAAVMDAVMNAGPNDNFGGILAASGDPRLQAAAVDMAIKARQPKPMETLAPGATVYDPNSRQAVFTAPTAEPKVTPTDDIKNLDRINQERKAAGQPALTLEEYRVKPDTQKFDNLAKLRAERTKASESFVQTLQGYKRAETGFKEDNGAGDLALVYGVAKMLDPNSVVRESEFATTQQVASLPARIQGYFAKVTRGDRLSQQARDDLIKMAEAQLVTSRGLQKRTDTTYTDLTRAFGYDPAQVVTPFEDLPPEMPAPPAAAANPDLPRPVQTTRIDPATGQPMAAAAQPAPTVPPMTPPGVEGRLPATPGNPSFMQQQMQAAAQANTVPEPVRVNTIDEAMALQPGTRFITPDGRVKVR